MKSSNPKLLCVWNEVPHLGGAERRMARIMNLVSSQDVEVDFLFLLEEISLDRIRDMYSQALSGECMIRFSAVNNSREIFHYVRNSRADLACYMGFVSPKRILIPYLAADSVARIPTLMFLVSTGQSIHHFPTFLHRVAFDVAAVLADRIDCLYPSATESVQRRFPMCRVTTTPCPGTLLDVFVPAEKKKVIAFVSRWVEVKNVRLFFDSVLAIEEDLYQAGYIVQLCGKSSDGQMEEYIARRLASARHPEIIHCPGFIKPETVLPEAELFLSLQDINNYPSQSLLEAISSGCYIIASDEGDTRRIVKPEFGTCCKLSVPSVAKSILEYLKISQEDKMKAVEAARSFALENFHIETSAAYYADIAREAAATKKQSLFRRLVNSRRQCQANTAQESDGSK